jgi:hypothetical protein
VEFIEPESFGHCPQLDSPQELHQLIQTFHRRLKA